MSISKLDLMRLAQAADCDFNIADFTPEELEELAGILKDDPSPEELRRRYFEFYDDIKDRVLPKHKWSD